MPLVSAIDAQALRRFGGDAGEGLAHEAFERCQQGFDLCREGVDRQAALRRVLMLQQLRGAPRQALREVGQARPEIGRDAGGIGVEHQAPEVLALRGVEIAEGFDKAGKQVGLGHQQIDRKGEIELAAQLVQARRDRCRLAREFCAAVQQVRHADADDHAIDRLHRPVPAQQRQELLPFPGVGCGVAVLCGVASRGVDEDGVLAEPPVAVTRAAGTRERVAPEPLGERKAQTRMQQRRGLAAPGRTDDQVPGQLLHLSPALPPALRPLRLDALPQHRERLAETLAQLGAGIAGFEALQQALVAPPGQQHPQPARAEQQERGQRQQGDAGAHVVEGMPGAEGEQRCCEPQQGACCAEVHGALREAGRRLHSGNRTISTRRSGLPPVASTRASTASRASPSCGRRTSAAPRAHSIAWCQAEGVRAVGGSLPSV